MMMALIKVIAAEVVRNRSKTYFECGANATHWQDLWGTIVSQSDEREPRPHTEMGRLGKEKEQVWLGLGNMDQVFCSDMLNLKAILKPN